MLRNIYIKKWRFKVAQTWNKYSVNCVTLHIVEANKNLDESRPWSKPTEIYTRPLLTNHHFHLQHSQDNLFRRNRTYWNPRTQHIHDTSNHRPLDDLRIQLYLATICIPDTYRTTPNRPSALSSPYITVTDPWPNSPRVIVLCVTRLHGCRTLASNNRSVAYLSLKDRFVSLA